MSKMNPFKICPKCAYTWKTRDEFLEDPFVCLVGFQFNFKETESGYFLFNHILEDDRCDTTMMVAVEPFLSLNKGPMFNEIKFGSEECEGHCKNISDLSLCSVECKNAVARKIMQDFSRCKIR